MASKAAGSIELPTQPMDCCISSSAPLIASSLVNGQVLLHRHQVQPGAAAADDQECSTSYTTTQVLNRESKKGASCRAVAFCSADDAHLGCGFETGTLLLLDVSTGKLISRLSKAHSAGISRLLTVPQQPWLVAAGDDGGGLRLWDVRSGSHVMNYSKHTDFITGLTVQERQQALLAVSGDGTLSVHDLRSCQALAQSESDADDELLSVAVVKQGKKVVCGSQSGVLAIWSWGYWNDCSDRFPGHPESVDALVMFDEDTVITGSSDGALRVINILPNKLVGVVGVHDQDVPVERLALSADRALLVSASHDTTVKLWDLSVLADDSEAEEDEQAGGHQAVSVSAGEATGGAGVAPATETTPVGSSKRLGEGACDSKDDAGKAVGASGSDSDDSDGEQAKSKKKRRKSEKTAMRGRSQRSAPSSNFFADLL